MNTSEVRAALRERFSAPEFGLIEEVRNGTGLQARVRTADALAMSLWPSRGLALHGFEIKASRSDWLAELKDPGKAEEIARYCHHWWVVVGDSTIVKDGELPKTWGLIVPRGKKLSIKVQAPELKPQMVNYKFLAAIFRKLSESAVTPEQHHQAVIAARKDGAEHGNLALSSQLKSAERQIEELTGRIAQFEEASGVNIGRWDHTRIGEAVKFVRAGGLAQTEKAMATLHREAEGLMAHCAAGKRALVEMREL